MYEISNLILPEDLPEQEEYNKLSYTRKGFFIENLLYQIFELNKNRKEGIAINELKKNLYFSKNSILRVLTKLLASRDIYCIRGRPIRYYKNGRISHHFLNSKILLKNQSFEFRLFANDFGDIKIFIQEKSRDPFAKNEFAGGIIIDADSFDEFVDAMYDKIDIIKEELNIFKKELKRLID